RALLIDYGYVRPEGADTLQALKAHAHVDPLEAPGAADLTAHVDFARVAHLAQQAGLAVHGPVTQASFLRGLGVEFRAEALARANPEHAERLARELRRLTHPEEMGALFKVICLSSPKLPPPAGF
ncbi:MAG: SAM-dependent methyltransferase, partial [Hyphomonadaceae bacterium]|nr:SAM-dependent methyltransferase [Hyphomonadaceae bacterium]